MVQFPFWYQFQELAAPIAAYPGAYIEIPTYRNIGISGFGYGTDDAAAYAHLGVRYQNGSIRWLLPTAWDDSVTAIGNCQMGIYTRTLAEYTAPMREIKFDPVQICDVDDLIVGVVNGAAGTIAIGGHVRGIAYG